MDGRSNVKINILNVYLLYTGWKLIYIWMDTFFDSAETLRSALNVGVGSNRQLLAEFDEYIGHDDTATLLLAGAEGSSDVFKKSVKHMKDLLMGDYVGVNIGKLVSVYSQIPSSGIASKKSINEAVSKIEKDLKGSENGRFIFYYAGQFSSDRGFLVDSREEVVDNWFLEKDLAMLLKKIEAKYVLLIMDVCCSDSDYSSEPPIPRFQEVFMGHKISKKKRGRKEKVVQWTRCSPHKTYSHKDGYSCFSKAITYVVTGSTDIDVEEVDLQPGSLVQLNKQVTKYLQGTDQTLDLKPADDTYLRSFPKFARFK